MINQNKILNGSKGTAWLNGTLLATLSSIQLKVTGNFDDVNFCGDLSTYSVFTGWKGEGTIKINKIDSTVLKLVADGYKTGNVPELKIITKLTDSVSGQSERVAVTGVVISEFMIANFENKKVVEEEIPVKFTGYEVIETIS